MPKSQSFAAGVPLGRLVGDHDVARLDVAVDHAAGVRMGQRLAQRRADHHDVAVRQRPLGQQLPERRAADELGDEVARLLVGAGLVERDDARMAEARGGLRLALGALGIAVVERNALERDRAVQALVMGEPDRPEAARAEPAHQAVAAEQELGLAGRSAHGVRMRHRLARSGFGKEIPCLKGIVHVS